MGTMLNPNMCRKSTDHCGFNRMGQYIRKNGFSGFVIQNLHTAISLIYTGFRNLDQRTERQRLKQPIVCITLPYRLREYQVLTLL
jgi:hypothetical protein